ASGRLWSRRRQRRARGPHLARRITIRRSHVCRRRPVLQRAPPCARRSAPSYRPRRERRCRLGSGAALPPSRGGAPTTFRRALLRSRSRWPACLTWRSRRLRRVEFPLCLLSALEANLAVRPVAERFTRRGAAAAERDRRFSRLQLRQRDDIPVMVDEREVAGSEVDRVRTVLANLDREPHASALRVRSVAIESHYITSSSHESRPRD